MSKTIARERILWNQILALVGHAATCALCLALIVYLRVTRAGATRGDARAAARLILPAYEPLLWILCLVTGCYALFFSIALRIKLFTTTIPRLEGELMYGGRQFVFALVVVFLLQKSVSLPAVARSSMLSLVLATYTIIVVWVVDLLDPELDSSAFFWIQAPTRCLVLALYVYAFLRPPTRASKRSIRHYCVFVVVYHGLLLTTTAVTSSGSVPVLNALLGWTTLLWSLACPPLVWRLLRADTEFWRGMGERICTAGGIGINLTQLQNQPIHDHISSAGIHHLIEMHRKYVIDFAHLNIGCQIGVGSSSVIYSGELRASVPVAIKMYTPRAFSEHTIAEFSHEAALSASLRHPNVVSFIGICVFPPQICLIVELCRGTLEEVMAGQHQQVLWRMGRKHTTGILLSYMLDVTRAIAYLHSFTPPMLHRDVKPANFLVSAGDTVKLTDFGDSRQLPHTLISTTESASAKGIDRSLQSTFSRSSSLEESESSEYAAAIMTVTGTVDYMPPEMIRGRSGLAAYGQAADVYSLAVTLWDILYPQRNKYAEVRDNSNHFQVLERVLAGGRPEFDVDVHPKLRDLIVWGWHPDPNCRPSAQQLVAGLESLQEETLASLAVELSDDFDRLQGVVEISTTSAQPSSSSGSSNSRSHGSETRRTDCFSGQEVATRMEKLFGVDAQLGESVRLGNAFMDAGFLHHASHSRGFERDSKYFFDSDAISFCQPVALLEDTSDVASEDEVHPLRRSVASTAASHQRPRALVRPASGIFSSLARSFSASSDLKNSASSSPSSRARCRCRQLAQGFELADPAVPARSWAWRARARRLQQRQSAHKRLGGDSARPQSTHVALNDPSALSRRLLDPEHELFAIMDDEAWSGSPV